MRKQPKRTPGKKPPAPSVKVRPGWKPRQANDKEFDRYIGHAHMKLRKPMRDERAGAAAEKPDAPTPGPVSAPTPRPTTPAPSTPPPRTPASPPRTLVRIGGG